MAVIRIVYDIQITFHFSSLEDRKQMWTLILVTLYALFFLNYWSIGLHFWMEYEIKRYCVHFRVVTSGGA